jgi:hypothetical protein
MKRNVSKLKTQAETTEAVEDNTPKAAARGAAKKPAGEVVPFFPGGGDMVDPAALQSAMSALGRQAQSGGLFMKFTKSGEWLYGPAQDEVSPEDLWAVNPGSFVNGYIGWKNGMPIGEHMCSVTRGMPCRYEELEPIEAVTETDGWSAQLGFTVNSYPASGDDAENLELIFKTTSHGGKKAAAGLADEISKRMSKGDGTFVPIVSLSADSYKHKNYGKIIIPVIRVVAWADMNGNVAEITDAGVNMGLEL